MLEKDKTQKNTKINAFLLSALFLTCSAMFFFGCLEKTQTPSGVPKVTKLTIPEQQATQIVFDALADKDPSIRVNAIEVAAETRQIRMMPRVRRLMVDDFVPVRFAAILAVGDTQYSFAEKTVKVLLRDKEQNVTIAACYAMYKLGHPDYIKVIQKAAITAKDQTVRANAAMLLGKTGDKNSLKYIYRCMQREDSDDKVKYQSVESIAMLGDERVFPELLKMLISAYSDVKIMGIKAAGALGTTEAKNELIKMLDDEITEIRVAAAEQLGKLKDKSGETEVLDVFEKGLAVGRNKQDRERIYVLTALAIGQIGTSQLKDYLPQLLQDESKRVRLAAAKAVLQGRLKK